MLQTDKEIGSLEIQPDEMWPHIQKRHETAFLAIQFTSL